MEPKLTASTGEPSTFFEMRDKMRKMANITIWRWTAGRDIDSAMLRDAENGFSTAWSSNALTRLWHSRCNKNVGKWYMGVEEGVEEVGEAWRCEDLRRSNRPHKQETVVLIANKRADITDTGITARENYRTDMVKRVARIVPD